MEVLSKVAFSKGGERISEFPTSCLLMIQLFSVRLLRIKFSF